MFQDIAANLMAGIYLSVRRPILRIKQAFDANGITIPFPTRTLELMGDPSASP